MANLNLSKIHPSWQEDFTHAMNKLEPDYLEFLSKNKTWLPGPDKIFNAFSIDKNKINYVLLGESPYPRSQSANGYAFWDNDVNEIWSPTGLSKKINRATSLRNIIKLLLICDGQLIESDLSQPAISKINKKNYISHLDQLFKNLLDHGVLLLNASLVLSDKKVSHDAKLWQGFIISILNSLIITNPNIQFWLFGKIAEFINNQVEFKHTNKIIAEHPYNLSFISNPEIQNLFKPLNLLRAPND